MEDSRTKAMIVAVNREMDEGIEEERSRNDREVEFKSDSDSQDEIKLGVERVSEAAAEDRMEDSDDSVAMRGGGLYPRIICGTDGQDSVPVQKYQQTIAHKIEMAHHAKSGFSSTMLQCTVSPLQEREPGPAGSGEELE